MSQEYKKNDSSMQTLLQVFMHIRRTGPRFYLVLLFLLTNIKYT
jgi:hypothetical protein